MLKFNTTHPKLASIADKTMHLNVESAFAVQFLVLRHAAQHPALRGNIGNVALLHAAAQAGLIPVDLAQAVGQGYMALRTAQHQSKLQGAAHAWFKRDSQAAQALLRFSPEIRLLCNVFASHA